MKLSTQGPRMKQIKFCLSVVAVSIAIVIGGVYVLMRMVICGDRFNDILKETEATEDV